MADKNYRDALTGQFTTAEDAAARPAETVSESVPTRHEAPDVAELRRLAEACPKPGSDPHILGPWWDAGDLARIPVDVPADREFIMAASPAAVLALLDDADALRAELAHMTEARDNARAEVERLTAKVERVRRECVIGKGYAGWAALSRAVLAALDGEPQP